MVGVLAGPHANGAHPHRGRPGDILVWAVPDVDGKRGLDPDGLESGAERGGMRLAAGAPELIGHDHDIKDAFEPEYAHLVALDLNFPIGDKSDRDMLAE
jgi:hypothetical protein